MRYGVLGKSLPHTYSPKIHSYFADYDYEVIERDEDGVMALFKEPDIGGFNVTIPYKKLAMSLCDEISDEASEAGAVNTVVRLSDGKFKGYNTDIYGFTYMLKREGIGIKGRRCLILGTGGASAAVDYALKKLGAQSISFCSRSGEINYSNVYDRLSDTEVIINTTPVGMYPDTDKCPIDLGRFPKLQAVGDLIYNPSRTKFLQTAKDLGVKTSGGLSMLVAQAYKASLIFRGLKFEEPEGPVPEIDRVIRELEKSMLNITLIGMPGSGKSTVGKKIAEALGKDFIDLDEEFIRRYGIKPSVVIETKGEDEFRKMESSMASEVLVRSGLVISTGGGIVTREENAFFLKANSRVIYIKRSRECLMGQDTSQRPVSRAEGIEGLYNRRRPLYERYADIVWDLGDFKKGDGMIPDLIKEL